MEAVLIFIAGTAAGSLIVTWFACATAKLPLPRPPQKGENPFLKTNGLGPIIGGSLTTSWHVVAC